MIKTKVNTSDLRRLRRDLDNFNADLRRNTMEGTKNIAKELKKTALQLAAVNKWKGRIYDAISEGFVSVAKKRNVIVTKLNLSRLSQVDHFLYQEYGFKPHWVSAFKHPEIGWWARDHDVDLFRGHLLKVSKPYNKRGYMIGEAYYQTAKKIDDIVMDAINQAGKNLNT